MPGSRSTMSYEMRLACLELLACLRWGRLLTELALENLLEAEANATNQKLLIAGLQAARLISDDTAAQAIAQRWPLKEE